ncbi:agamous-like MADS-box protein AGL80 [Triticum dicoccoides]|uniref:agamous-like MADS-box protein AGL80 n=1 Tax=Triticum dicoccoides TaxID=85692 RepID=UPI001891AA29|nr:agamous-like MADS-box protein AGL80 [Triticum dicoccoides]
MARKKVALRYIRNDSTRLNTLKKRTKNLMKKAGDVATLCNAKACVLVYGEGTTVPEVFPSQAKAVAILNRFKSMTEVPQLKKTMDQETILSQRLVQLRHQVEKIRREREDREARILLHKALVSGDLPGNIAELTTMAWKMELILKSLGERTTNISGQPPVYQAQAPYVTGGMDMGSPMYQALRQQQKGWLDMARSKGDPDAQIYNGHNSGL